MKKKTIQIILIALLICIIMIVGTSAWLKHHTKDTKLVLIIGEMDDIQVTLSPYQIEKSISPQLSYKSDNYTSVSAINSSPNSKSFRLYYKINNIDSKLINSNFKYTIEKSTDGTTFTEYKTGTFASASNNQELTILDETIPSITTYNYKVYIWLQDTGSNQTNIIGTTFNGELRAEIASDQYQFVEYLESTGTQYINTGYIPTVNTDMEIDFAYMGAGTTAWVPICGERSGNNSTYLNFFVNAAALKLTPNYAGYDPGANSGLSTITIGTRYNLRNRGGNFYLNDELKDSTPNTLTVGTTPIYVFAIGNGSGVDNRNIYMKLYSFKIYNNNELVRDLIPSYRKRDNAIGLYDTVNSKFYTNAGSGTFQIGPEI